MATVEMPREVKKEETKEIPRPTQWTPELISILSGTCRPMDSYPKKGTHVQNPHQ